MDEPLQTISRALLFSGLSRHQLQEIAGIAVERAFEKEQMVFFEGDEGVGFFLILTGLVKVFKVSLEGKEQILHIFGAGEPFGEVPVFSGKSFPASAQAIQRSRILFFPREAFFNLICSNPSLAMNMLAVLSMRLRQFTIQVENLSLKEIPARLAGYLDYLLQEQQSADSVILPISKAQLASLLGTIPETLSRIFQKMSHRKLIEVQGAHIRILDSEGLAALSEQGSAGG